MQARTAAVRDMVSGEEWQARVDLAAAYRLVALFGWDDLIFTHISARAPGPEHHFLINPYGLMFDEITASSLVKVGLDGKKVMDSSYDINPAGFTIHSAVHAARADAWRFRQRSKDCFLSRSNRCSYLLRLRITTTKALR
jgi:Class II Aldolase and Adducin N-terminal domain